MAREIQDLLHTNETVAEISIMLRGRAILVPKFVVDEEMKMAIYHDMLKSDIRKFVCISNCRTSEDMVVRAR